MKFKKYIPDFPELCAIVLMLGLLVCGVLALKSHKTKAPTEHQVVEAPAIAKVIALKTERVEQKLSFDIFDNQSIRTRAKTVYYLVAEDGTGVQVRLSEFARAKVGEKWSAQYWHNVD